MWVAPVPWGDPPILQQRPNDYGIPMDVEVAYIQDGFLTNDVLQEMVSMLGGNNTKTPFAPARITPRPRGGLAGALLPVPIPSDGDHLFSIPDMLPRSQCHRGGGALGQPPCLQLLSPPHPRRCWWSFTRARRTW